MQQPGEGVQPCKITQEQKAKILRGAPMGMNMTYKKLKLYIDWPGMKKDVEEYIQK
jgi:hypothetical protein